MVVGHLGTAMCKSGAGRKRRRLASTVVQVAAGKDFWEWYQVLENIYIFNYLVTIISFENMHWTMLARNLKRLQRKWGQLSHLLFQ